MKEQIFENEFEIRKEILRVKYIAYQSRSNQIKIDLLTITTRSGEDITKLLFALGAVEEIEQTMLYHAHERLEHIHTL